MSRIVDLQIIIGRGTFNRNFTRKMKKDFLKYHHKHMLQSKIWFMTNGKFIDKNWTAVMPYIKQSGCQLLFLENNCYSNILFQICQPVYTNLKSFTLQGNFITSIEPLSFMSIENIEKIDLKHNSLITTKALNKTRWRFIKELCLGQNPVKNIDISRMKMSQNMTLELEDKTENCSNEDFSSIIGKLEIKKSNCLKINSRQRIQQHIVFNSISKKYPKIQAQINFYY